jgi:glycerol uptake facilitator-like aquaporin
MSQHPILSHALESVMILIFECLGTGLLTMLFIAVNGWFGFIPGVFVLLILSARISGSHYNPIITLAFMLRRDAGQFNKWLGILYMLAQLAGAYLGCIFIFYCFDKRGAYLSVDNGRIT